MSANNSAYGKLNIPRQYQEELMRISKPATLQKGDYFIRHGQVPKKIAFVIQGLFRYLYIDTGGNEFTKGLIAENGFMSSYSAMIAQTPSWFCIEALEQAEILEIAYPDWLELQKTDRFWDQFLIAILEKAFVTKERRERELLLLDAGSRYRIFRSEFPELEKRVSLQIIASYLGIQPESLSRIRKKTGA